MPYRAHRRGWSVKPNQKGHVLQWSPFYRACSEGSCVKRIAKPIHRANSPNQFTEPIHRANSPNQFTEPIHRANSPSQFTEPIHKSAPRGSLHKKRPTLGVSLFLHLSISASLHLSAFCVFRQMQRQLFLVVFHAFLKECHKGIRVKVVAARFGEFVL